MNSNSKHAESEHKDRTWTEEIEIAGNQLVDRVQELFEEGTVRRLIIRKPDNEVLMEIPLTAGIAVGGVVTLFVPVLAALGAMAALVAHFRVEIVRIAEQPEELTEGTEVTQEDTKNLEVEEAIERM